MRAAAVLLLGFASLFAVPSRAGAGSCGIILTIGGTPDTLGDSQGTVPALSGELDEPLGTAVDAYGNAYVADSDNNVVREIVKASGQMLIVAGTGSPWESGDNGPATEAGLDTPMGVCVDPVGDLFITDFGGNCVREVVQSTGLILRVAGNGNIGYTGDQGPATAATLYGPEDAALDSYGNVYISDQWNFVVRKVSASTGVITTVAGNGTRGYSGDGAAALSAQLYRPVGVALDAAGDLYISDYGNDAVRRVDAASGVITTVAGLGSASAGYGGDGGPATQAKLDWPQDVALDSQGDLYIADFLNSAIREVYASNGAITTVAGMPPSTGYSGNGGPATQALMDFPFGVASDSQGDIVIGDSVNEVVREVSCLEGTPGPTPTPTPSATPAYTWTQSCTFTISPTFTVSPTLSETLTLTDSPTVTRTFTVSPTPTATPSANFFSMGSTIAIGGLYPNPFSSTLTVYYLLRDASAVTLAIYNVAGERIATLGMSGVAGKNVLVWDGVNSEGRACASGVYLLHLSAVAADGSGGGVWQRAAIAR